MEHVPKKQPVLFVSNHNNALIDALLIVTQSGRLSYFLTRASVFKKPFVNWLLRSLNMLPVYRVRDGWSSISNNNAIFESCSLCLSQNEAVALFPEGNHHMNRTVRPLSKGFTRIVFETLEHYPTCDLKIIPIGLNFEQLDAFADSVLLYFGTPISANTYLQHDVLVETKRLKKDVWKAITKLTTHIPAADYDETMQKLKSMDANFLNPDAVHACVESDFTNCGFSKKEQPTSLKAFFKFLMIVLLIGPYAIWKFVAEPKIKEVEFVATFRFGMVITLVPIWMLFVTLVLILTLGLPAGLAYIFATFSMALLAVKL
ncbi:glycerol acyltransferase [Bizionia myxarmorum]|uniref:Glycerol acyltransferase n=1 Tax=Bizionia myxarmorum TaxID=291186 RepID=A0A5D0R8T8_9FLAO|nr:glycerol acyltransferase [Bizionia myxarmorum]